MRDLIDRGIIESVLGGLALGLVICSPFILMAVCGAPTEQERHEAKMEAQERRHEDHLMRLREAEACGTWCGEVWR